MEMQWPYNVAPLRQLLKLSSLILIVCRYVQLATRNRFLPYCRIVSMYYRGTNKNEQRLHFWSFGLKFVTILLICYWLE